MKYLIMIIPINFLFFFFNDTAPTEIYTSVHTLSLHDALPISRPHRGTPSRRRLARLARPPRRPRAPGNRRSEEHTSELQSRTLISYAVFCLKKKNNSNYIILHNIIIIKEYK